MARRSDAEICAAISVSAARSWLSGRPSAPKFRGADQPAMHDQVGVAADRRGEVRVAAEVQSEVAVVLRRIFGLRLRAQHHLVDELLDVLAFDLRQDAVELLGPHRAALGQRDVQRVEELAQRLDLLQRRLVVHAIDQRHARLFQRLGGGDIGEDHELLDQPVRLQPLRRDDAIDGAVGLEQDFPLGQIEVERTARVAGFLQRLIGGVERLEHVVDQRVRSPRRCGRRSRPAPAGN